MVKCWATGRFCTTAVPTSSILSVLLALAEVSCRVHDEMVTIARHKSTANGVEGRMLRFDIEGAGGVGLMVQSQGKALVDREGHHSCTLLDYLSFWEYSNDLISCQTDGNEVLLQDVGRSE